MKVEVAVLGTPSLIIVLNMVSVDVKQHRTQAIQLRKCVKVEVAVLVVLGRKATLNSNTERPGCMHKKGVTPYSEGSLSTTLRVHAFCFRFVRCTDWR